MYKDTLYNNKRLQASQMSIIKGLVLSKLDYNYTMN